MAMISQIIRIVNEDLRWPVFFRGLTQAQVPRQFGSTPFIFIPSKTWQQIQKYREIKDKARSDTNQFLPRRPPHETKVVWYPRVSQFHEDLWYQHIFFSKSEENVLGIVTKILKTLFVINLLLATIYLYHYCNYHRIINHIQPKESAWFTIASEIWLHVHAAYSSLSRRSSTPTRKKCAVWFRHWNLLNATGLLRPDWLMSSSDLRAIAAVFSLRDNDKSERTKMKEKQKRNGVTLNDYRLWTDDNISWIQPSISWNHFSPFSLKTPMAKHTVCHWNGPHSAELFLLIVTCSLAFINFVVVAL